MYRFNSLQFLRMWLLFFVLTFVSVQLHAQKVAYGKLSSDLRQWVITHPQESHPAAFPPQSAFTSSSGNPSAAPSVCAFVSLEGNADSLLAAYQGRILLQKGKLCVADIPLKHIASLSNHPQIHRIEARAGKTATLDTTAICLGIDAVYQANNLPQAYTGAGVVMGIQDIGFDLTHPTFYDKNIDRYRIARLWDQLSADTINSQLYVGGEVVGKRNLLAYQHSRDGKDETHGTHTAGIAAGAGWGSAYRGIAYDSDLCLVANAVNSNIHLVDSVNRYKYTYATDALGFDYIFRYAASVNKPCVISFSEGSPEDVRGDDMLYHAMLDSLVGPGRILVASAGNQGKENHYLYKPKGMSQSGAFVLGSGSYSYQTILTDQPTTLTFKVYQDDITSYPINLFEVEQQADSTLRDTFTIANTRYILSVVAYVPVHNPRLHAFDVLLQSDKIGVTQLLAMVVDGAEADVELFQLAGQLYHHDKDPSLVGAANSHSIFSPGSAHRVICVGANTYRTGFVNYKGQYQSYPNGSGGYVAPYSSVGPTINGRIKPDVVAPGTNIISAYSSFYLENHPNASDIRSDVQHFPFKDRVYAWNANTGTSMSAPIVGGIIALWLQANPHLSPEDVMEILSTTSKHPDTTLTYPNNYYGFGEIDAYKGLLHILHLTDIAEIPLSRHNTVFPDKVQAGKVYLTFPAHISTPYSVRVYNLQGKLQQQCSLTPVKGKVCLNLSQLPSDVYVVVLTTTHETMQSSFLVRI